MNSIKISSLSFLSNLDLSPSFSKYAIVLLTLLCITGLGYYACVIYSTFAFMRRSRSIVPDFYPPVTILKPICGLDDAMYRNLASFCQQDYPEYQIIFSVIDERDP